MSNYGNKDVSTLIAHLESKVGSLDRSKLDNRRACWSLMLRVKADYPDADPVQGITHLIDIVFSGNPKLEFHRLNTTNFRYLLNNAGKIANIHRASKGSSSNDYAASAADSLARKLADRQG